MLSKCTQGFILLDTYSIFIIFTPSYKSFEILGFTIMNLISFEYKMHLTEY